MKLNCFCFIQCSHCRVWPSCEINKIRCRQSIEIGISESETMFSMLSKVKAEKTNYFINCPISLSLSCFLKHTWVYSFYVSVQKYFLCFFFIKMPIWETWVICVKGWFNSTCLSIYKPMWIILFHLFKSSHTFIFLVWSGQACYYHHYQFLWHWTIKRWPC